MTRPFRSSVRRQLLALGALVVYFLLVAVVFWDGATNDSPLSVIWVLIGVLVMYGLSYLAFPLVTRVMTNLSGTPVSKHRSRR